MLVICLTVRDLIAHLNDRECFQSVIPDDEIDRLIDAAERLVGRARQELNARLTAEFLSGYQPPLHSPTMELGHWEKWLANQPLGAVLNVDEDQENDQ
jgi:hypothetical protein